MIDRHFNIVKNFVLTEKKISFQQVYWKSIWYILTLSSALYIQVPFTYLTSTFILPYRFHVTSFDFFYETSSKPPLKTLAVKIRERTEKKEKEQSKILGKKRNPGSNISLSFLIELFAMGSKMVFASRSQTLYPCSLKLWYKYLEILKASRYSYFIFENKRFEV